MMPCVSVHEIHDAEVCGHPPWMHCYRPVSLLDMLRYSAQSFITATSTIAQIAHILNRGEVLTDGQAGALGGALGELMRECEKLDLPMTNLLLKRIQHQLTELLSRFSDELSTTVMFKVESSKAIYVDPSWLMTTPLYTRFPNAWKEMQSAGKCYAYGEGTACSFHLNRALEWGLKTLAVHIGKSFNRNSWDAHLKDIERELEARYKTSQARTAEERFYSEVATQFGHMKVAWRNPTMHIEAHYDNGEAVYLLTLTEKFMQHLAAKGLAERLSE
jgi:hypothetical protein